MPVQMAVRQRQNVYIHLETTNQSFLDMHYYLKAKGIKNNAFFLSLFDTDLVGVDPFDPNLSTLMKQKVLRECIINYWYFLREVARLDTQGSTRSGGVRYKLHRGNLAMNFLYILNKNMFIELPRQHGKTTAAIFRYLWVFNFGTTNSEIMFIHKNHDGSKENLQRLKNYREMLPSYLRMDSTIGYDGKKLKVPNTVEVLQHPSNGNRIKTLPSAKNKMLANTLGRGCTQPLQYYDEFGWIMHNQLIYNSATPAYKRASQNAKENGAPYGIVLTTTPGDLTTPEGAFAYQMLKNATPWQEEFYDFTYEQIQAVSESNENSSFFYIKYSYMQLGSDETYFKEMVKDLNKDWAVIRREVLLEWSDISDNCPFSKEDLDVIQQFCLQPIKNVPFGPWRQYWMQIYKEMDPSHGQIIGVDVSGGFRRDSSAITIIDANTTEVVATLNCNYMPVEDLAHVIYELVTKYLPQALVAIEKNGVGIGLLSRLIKTSIKKNLYYEVKSHDMTERSNGTTIQRGSQMVKVYGVDNSGPMRNRLIEILFSRVQYHKDKFIAQILHDEMAGLTYKTNQGHTRVDHSVNTHDDQIFSYLMAMYVWYDCPDLVNRFGIVRGEIKTDDDIEERMGAIESLYGDGYELIDIVDDTVDENSPLADETTQQILNDVKRAFMTTRDLHAKEEMDDFNALQAVLKTPQGKAAVERAYNIDLSNVIIGGLDQSYLDQGALPSDVFENWYDDEEYDDAVLRKLHGNLYDSFVNLSD